MLRNIDKYFLWHRVVGDRGSLWDVHSLSILDLDGHQRYEEKREGAVLGMSWVCQPINRDMLWCGDEGSRERPCSTCRALLGIYKLFEGYVILIPFINLVVVLDVLSEARIYGDWL